MGFHEKINVCKKIYYNINGHVKFESYRIVNAEKIEIYLR